MICYSSDYSMDVYFKCLDKCYTPVRATCHSSGYDVKAANENPVVLDPGEITVVPLGFSISLPEGTEGQLRPRSGLAMRHGITCLNSPGTIDADYRGEVKVILINHGNEPFTIDKGMRVAQLVIAALPSVTLTEVDTLPSSGRGEGGFGSTGYH